MGVTLLIEGVSAADHMALKEERREVLELRESGDWLAQRAAPTGSTTRHRALSLDVVIAETPSAESFGTP